MAETQTRGLSKYAAKKARQVEEARLAALNPEPEDEEPETPEPEPEPQPVRPQQLRPLQPGEDIDGGRATKLAHFTPEQLAFYRQQVESWRAKTGKQRPGSNARRTLRQWTVRKVPS